MNTYTEIILSKEEIIQLTGLPEDMMDTYVVEYSIDQGWFHMEPFWKYLMGNIRNFFIGRNPSGYFMIGGLFKDQHEADLYIQKYTAMAACFDENLKVNIAHFKKNILPES